MSANNSPPQPAKRPISYPLLGLTILIALAVGGVLQEARWRGAFTRLFPSPLETPAQQLKLAQSAFKNGNNAVALSFFEPLDLASRITRVLVSPYDRTRAWRTERHPEGYFALRKGRRPKLCCCPGENWGITSMGTLLRLTTPRLSPCLRRRRDRAIRAVRCCSAKSTGSVLERKPTPSKVTLGRKSPSWKDFPSPRPSATPPSRPCLRLIATKVLPVLPQS